MDDIESKRIDRLLEDAIGDLSRFEDRETAVAYIIASWRERGEALKRIAGFMTADECEYEYLRKDHWDWASWFDGVVNIARAALNGKAL